MKNVARIRFVLSAAAAALMLPAAAQAVPVGPHANVCKAGKSAVVARVSGFKSASGIVSVKLYASNSKFLDKGAYLRKVEVPVRSRAPMDICVPVPASGAYALSVRHEVKGSKSRSDGGGFSGNPEVSLVDLALSRKPPLQQVSFRVNGSVRVVPVTLAYLQGGSIRPVS